MIIWNHLPSNFLVAEALGPSSHGVSVAVKLNWHETFGIVRADWAENYEGLALLYFAKTKSVVHANRSRSNIERVKRSMRDPGFLNFNEFLEASNHLLTRVFSKAQLSVGAIHALEVLIGAEKHDSLVMSNVSL